MDMKMFGEMYRNTMNDDFVKEILKHGWKKNDIYTIESNDINLPKELFDLCSRFSFLSNSQENSWIYSVNYYKSKLDVAFEWDFSNIQPRICHASKTD